MRYSKYFRLVFFCVPLLFFCFISASIAYADTTETYAQACAQAISNAGNNGTVSSDWLASSGSIISVNSSDTHGLTYDSGGNLIVRTASTYGTFLSSYYVQSNYVYRPTTSPTADSAAWVVTGNDLTTFLTKNSATSANVINLTERGLGLPLANTHSVIIEYTVEVADSNSLMRPTKNPDITSYNPSKYGNSNTIYPFVQPANMSDTAFSNFEGFYANHLAGSYPSAYPWTQLGYTYFWGQTFSSYPPTIASQIKGMSEFVILPQTTVNIYGIYTIQSYIYTANNGSVFTPVTSGGQYGNGFASFDVTGPCDTIWAGSRFQANTRTSSSNPNQIIIETGKTVSGGQGILVWSLNYDVTNNGTISGPTAVKYNISGTDNIAILFEGDTSTTYGTPITSGINRLTNSGSISSAGTAPIAVEVVNGNSEVNNTGKIYTEGAGVANSYSIYLQNGTNTITNSNNSGAKGYIGQDATAANYSETGILIDSGSTTITNNSGGTIYGSKYAIKMAGGTNTINNYNTVNSPDTGIQVDGGTTTITNYSSDGGIYGTATAAIAVNSNGTANITNSGQITASTGDAISILGGSNTNTIVNNTGGVITTTMGAGSGIVLQGAVNNITNYGSISSNGAYAMDVLSGTNTLVNSGTMDSLYGVYPAIMLEGGTTTITNTGTIKGLTLKDNTTAILNVGNNTLTISGPSGETYSQGQGTTLRFAANSATDFGKVACTANAASVASASKVNVVTGGYIPNNTTFSNVIESTGAGVNVPGTISCSSPIFTFTGSNGTTHDHLDLTATRANTYQGFTSNSNTAAAGSVLNTLAANNTATGDMVTVLGALDSLASSGQIDHALNSMLPNVDNSAPQVTQETLDQFLSTVFAHLDAINNVTNQALKGPDVWTSGYGSYIHQDAMGASNGYNASVWGTALGCDFCALDNLQLGFSGGFAQDFIRSKDSSDRNDVNNYQWALYGSYAKDAYYIDTAFSFAFNTYDESRHVTVGTLDRTATGDYNGEQYSAYIGGGYKFTAKNVELTPLASFQYAHLRLNSYTEVGAGALNLKVDSQDYDVAQTGLGMKLGYPMSLKNGIGKLTPELKFKWLYDWISDAQQATSTFTGGGGSFGTNGFTPAQSSYDFGAKLILETANFTTLSLNYNLEIKENFYGHYGLLEVRHRF